MSYREAIRANYPDMTRSYQRIADYLLNNYIDVAFSHNVQELARAVDLDATTIVRFAQTIGYSGWLELRHEIMDSVCQEFKTNRMAGVEYHLDAHRAVLAYDQFVSKCVYPGNKEEMKRAAELYAEMVAKAEGALNG